jgi:hypothetical protein
LLGDDDSSEALAALHAPARWAELAEPGVNRVAALLPGGGLCGDVADLLQAAAPRRVLWSGSGLRVRLPPSIEVRERPAAPLEAAAWMEGPPPR